MKGLNQMPSGGSTLTGAFLQRVQQTSTLSAVVPDMQPGEIPLTLTLAQLAPNPDNPRKARNPRYDEIKDSIRNSGLDTVPRVTKDPASADDRYVFSNGGNTRYAILTELYEETRDERFFRILCVFRPWSGRLRCLLDHLKENDMRGDLTFIDRAAGIQKARVLYSEESRCGHLSLREFSDRLRKDGYSLDASEIQRMEYALEWLYPAFPQLFNAGMGRPQARNLIRLHRTLSETVSKNTALSLDINAIFRATAVWYDDPDTWDFTVFQDALTSALSSASPFSVDWWKLVLHGNTPASAAPVSLPVVSEQAQPEMVVTELPPADNPSPVSADTAPGTEIRTAGLTLEELADAHQDAGVPDNTAEHRDVAPPEALSGSDPRARSEYREEQLALGITEALPPVSDTDASCIALGTRSASRLRTQLLRQAFALAELAGLDGQVLSDDRPDGCGFTITQPETVDASGILAFLDGLATHSERPVLPLHWLAGDNHQAPEHDGAFPLAVSLLSGIATLRALVREQGTDTMTDEEDFE
ncbi:TPA: hypothetical protein OME38_004545 [Klebsiella oxytoca]|nr:hypothetical protein [Klebsiella oxytoca]